MPKKLVTQIFSCVNLNLERKDYHHLCFHWTPQTAECWQGKNSYLLLFLSEVPGCLRFRSPGNSFPASEDTAGYAITGEEDKISPPLFLVLSAGLMSKSQDRLIGEK